MVDDHEDYQPGEAPMAHKATHEDEGTDEISVAGLAGVPAELAAHALLPSIHHVKFTAAEARAAINNIFGSDGKADADINLDTHKLINVVDPVNNQDADTKIARATALSAHAILPTVHQDAPQLILDHKGDASAHHAYIEGTWTPVVTGETTPGTYEITIANAYYTKIGRLLFLSCNIIRLAVVTGGGVGNLLLGGLPYLCSTDNSFMGTTYHYGNVLTKDYTLAFVAANTHSIRILSMGVDGSQALMQIGDFAANGQITVNLVYRV